jgi:hypothetical protein
MAVKYVALALAAIALIAVLGVSAQTIGGVECPPKSGDVYYVGTMGEVSMFLAAWIAAEHAVNQNSLANKPTVGCFDFQISLFAGGPPSEDLMCTDESDYRFPSDSGGDASTLGDLYINPDCGAFCMPRNSIRYDTNCEASRGNPGAYDVLSQEDLIAVVGAGCSGPSTEAGLVFAELGVPMVSPSSTSGRLSDVEKYPTFFRTAAGDDGQAKALLDLATSFGITKAAVIATRDAFSQSFAEGIARFAPGNDIEMTTVALICEDTNCEGYYDEVYQKMSDIKDSGVKTIFSTSHCTNARLIQEIAYKLDMTADNCYMFISGDASANDACWDRLSTESAYGVHTDFVPKESNLGFTGTQPRGGSGDIYKDFTGFWAEQDECIFPGQIHQDGVFDVEQFTSEAYDALLTIAVGIKNIREAGGEVTRAALIEEIDKDDFVFQGATGIVSFGGEFEPPIGDHDRPPIYDIVAFEGVWLVVGYWSPLDVETVNLFLPIIFPTASLEPPECLIG